MAEQPAFTVRRNDDGTLDEIVAHDVRLFHLEQQDDGAWWIGVDAADGQHYMINLESRGRIVAMVELDGPSMVRSEGA